MVSRIWSIVRQGKDHKGWTMRWKAPLNAFQIAFEGRLTSSNNRPPSNQDQPLAGIPDSPCRSWSNE
jgi:hypothetical protein